MVSIDGGAAEVSIGVGPVAGTGGKLWGRGDAKCEVPGTGLPTVGGTVLGSGAGVPPGVMLEVAGVDESEIGAKGGSVGELG